MKYLFALALLSGCTQYDVKAQHRAPDFEHGEGPIITCKSATLMDEGGVCHDFKSCSDGRDHLKSVDGCEWMVIK